MKNAGKTVKIGEAVYDLQHKNREELPVFDLAAPMLKKLEQRLIDFIEEHKSGPDFYYIILHLRNFRILKQVTQQILQARYTRPKPNWDMSLFSYNNRTGELKFYWVVPDKKTCEMLLAHQKEVPSEQQELLGYVKQFYQGTLV